MDILLGIILFFALFYYALKFFLRYGLPWLIARFMRKQQNKYEQQQGFNEDSREGEVRIKMKKQSKDKDDTGFGEYVDYEDVKE